MFGTSGAGKSTLMEILHTINPYITIHQKDTTRVPRKTESKEGATDLRFVKDFNKENYDLVYHKYGQYYGVRRDLLLKAFQNIINSYIRKSTSNIL